MAVDGTQDGTAAAAASSGTAAGSTGDTSPHQPSGTGGSTSAATSTAAGGQQTSSAATGAAGAAGNATAAEDRSTWVPPHRLRALSREQANLKRELDNARAQLAAVTGITPPQRGQARQLPPGVTEEMLDAARNELHLVRPELADLTAEDIKAIKDFLTNERPNLSEMHGHYNKQLGSSAVRTLNAEVKTQIGELSARGLQKLYGAFYNALQTDDQFFDRYYNGDPTLVSDFVNEYKQDVLDPYHTRRTSAATTSVTTARTLPRGGSSSSVVPAARSGDAALDPGDEDAVHKRAFQRMRARVSQGAGA